MGEGGESEAVGTAGAKAQRQEKAGWVQEAMSHCMATTAWPQCQVGG